MTTEERRAKLTAVTRFENAVHEFAFKGTYLPEDHDIIERKYIMAKTNLYRVIGLEVQL